ncbi:hypothetical protein D3C83_208500 [compost metagenome]
MAVLSTLPIVSPDRRWMSAVTGSLARSSSISAMNTIEDSTTVSSDERVAPCSSSGSDLMYATASWNWASRE